MIGALLLASALELGVGLAAGADLATTQVARNHGLYEANPVMSEPALAMTIKAGMTVAVIGTSRHLKKNGKPGWAKAVTISAIALWGGAAVWNMHKIQETRR